jgi:hypothetical protein
MQQEVFISLTVVPKISKVLLLVFEGFKMLSKPLRPSQFKLIQAVSHRNQFFSLLMQVTIKTLKNLVGDAADL